MKILLAIMLGTAFGFVLQRVGATDTKKIWGMLTLQDLHLVKAILLAIGLSSCILFTGMALGVIDAGHLSVKSSYYGVVVGGLILGLGWAVAGYCPGTGVAAMGEGKKDALAFVAGGFVGALLFTLTYESLAKGWLFEKIAGGKVTLASTPEYASLLGNVSPLLVALGIGVLFIIVAVAAPKKL